MLYVADKKFSEMEVDQQRWQEVIENLLLMEDKPKTFLKGFTEIKEAELVTDSVLETTMQLRVPTDEELQHLAEIMR